MKDSQRRKKKMRNRWEECQVLSQTTVMTRWKKRIRGRWKTESVREN